jgi:hypothetical protein
VPTLDVPNYITIIHLRIQQLFQERFGYIKIKCFLCRNYKTRIEYELNSADFWSSIHQIIADDFTSGGLQKLDEYAELFIRRKLLYQRFSSQEQYGCAAGGITHAIATLLAVAEDSSDTSCQGGSNFKIQCQRGEKQTAIIER